jgi:hypothetical protein
VAHKLLAALGDAFPGDQAVALLKAALLAKDNKVGRWGGRRRGGARPRSSCVRELLLARRGRCRPLARPAVRSMCMGALPLPPQTKLT